MLSIDKGPDGTVVISGRLDAAQAGTAQAFLDKVEGTVTLDCSALEYISSAGLGVLLKTQKRLLASGGKLRLVGVNRHLQDIFDIPGSTSLRNRAASGPLAVSHLSGPPRVFVDEDADRAAVERYRHGDREAAELAIRYQRSIYNAVCSEPGRGRQRRHAGRLGSRSG
jgi:anti-anti-sigma factor